jgi:UDP-N-acetylglucosamine enolpyruvyl transferase
MMQLTCHNSHRKKKLENFKMAEEIIDLRDRIEKMRVQIENEGTEQIKKIFLMKFTKKLKLQT